MSGDDQVLAIAGRLPEGLTGPGLHVPAVPWPTRREAARAAIAVACFVGAPALAAVGAVVALFALSGAVLLAPLVAAALTWTAWRCNRVEGTPGEASSSAGPDASRGAAGGARVTTGAAPPSL